MKTTERLPILEWLPRYRREDLRADVGAGLTVAVMLIPQSMAYAALAGMPPIHGLYAALLPALVYALLGTSRQLSVAPVALDSMLTATAVAAVAAAGSRDFVATAIALAALVGLAQIALAALGLGFLVNYLSRPVVSGFTSAAALVIGASQLGVLVGLSLQDGSVHRTLLDAASRIGQWHAPTLALGLAAFAVLQLLAMRAPRLPRAMLVAVLGVLAVWLLGLHERGVAIVGAVPSGLPALAWPRLDRATVTALAPSALTIALVAFMEAISVGRHFARLERHEVRPGQELLALGAANVASSLTGGFPVSGGFARTAVAAQAGARTPITGVVATLGIVLALLLLTPAFHFLPKAVLGAIVVQAVLRLVDVREARRLYRVKRNDFWLLVLTFAATLGVGVQYGILIGVGASITLFLVRSSRPHFAVLGRIPGTEAYLNVERHPHAITLPGVLVLRIDAPLYFGNVTFLKDTLRALEAERDSSLCAVVLDMSGINQLDSSAEDALAEIDAGYRERGVRLLFAHVKGPVRDVMLRTGLLVRLADEQRIFFRTHEAVLAAVGQHTGSHAHPNGPDLRAPADRIGCGAAPSLPPPPEVEED